MNYFSDNKMSKICDKSEYVRYVTHPETGRKMIQIGWDYPPSDRPDQRDTDPVDGRRLWLDYINNTKVARISNYSVTFAESVATKSKMEKKLKNK